MAEKKEMMMMKMKMKVEDGGQFDLSEATAAGFMELLGVQDYYLFTNTYSNSNSNSNSNPFQPNSAPHNSQDDIKAADTPINHCSQQQQQQSHTPNSSSISSASTTTTTTSEPIPHHDDDDDDEQRKTNKLLKVKKTKQKKEREPRFAFMTKSEVDHLEDGYRWRKYGQKAVKNSPFPRSYYRCTTASCNVKKRVERSLNDPTLVVTTYEGQHTHPSPIMPPRSSPFYHGSSMIPPAGTFASSLMPQNYYLSQYHHQHQQQQQQQLLLNTLSSLGLPPSSNSSDAFFTDYGLLQDVVPSHMFKQDLAG